MSSAKIGGGHINTWMVRIHLEFSIPGFRFLTSRTREWISSVGRSKYLSRYDARNTEIPNAQAKRSPRFDIDNWHCQHAVKAPVHESAALCGIVVPDWISKTSGRELGFVWGGFLISNGMCPWDNPSCQLRSVGGRWGGRLTHSCTCSDDELAGMHTTLIGKILTINETADGGNHMVSCSSCSFSHPRMRKWWRLRHGRNSTGKTTGIFSHYCRGSSQNSTRKK